MATVSAKLVSAILEAQPDALGRPVDVFNIKVGQDFKLDLLVRNYDPRCVGVSLLSLNLRWDPKILEEITPDIRKLVTPYFPSTGFVTRASGQIINLSGHYHPFAHGRGGIGRFIGQGKHERFVTFHFKALSIGTTALNFSFGRNGSALFTEANWSVPIRTPQMSWPNVMVYVK